MAAALAVCGVLCPQPRALAVQALPGSTWGQVTYQTDKLIGAGTMGTLNQGIDWVTLPGDITFNTFAEFDYRFRSGNHAFYNMYGPFLGMELRKSIFHLGAGYYWQRYPGINDTSNGMEFYLSWFQGWDLKTRLPGGIQNSLKVKGLSGSTWGRAGYQTDELVGAGAMGYVNQGIDWFTLPGQITFNTYVEFYYRFRSGNHDFYNAYGPTIGLEFQKSVFRLGAGYYWERYPGINDTSNGLRFYLTWFQDWDLKRTK